MLLSFSSGLWGILSDQQKFKLKFLHSNVLNHFMKQMNTINIYFLHRIVSINFFIPYNSLIFCRTADEVIENHEAGHLMRTKYLGVNEGGVNTGFSCLDTPFLIEWPFTFTTHLENLYISKQIPQDLELSILHENLSALVNVILKHRISVLLPLYLKFNCLSL